MFSVRRFGKGMRKLSLSNHGQWIEDYVFDYFLKETEPDCSLYAKDGTEKKILPQGKCTDKNSVDKSY